MAGRLRTIDARTLADAVLEPPGYAVKDLLVQGLHILAGAPKTGKSWLALWLCQQVAGGEKVWGYPTQQGTVLYLCLEDGYHRLQDRLLDITEDPSENLYLATHAGTLADGLAGQIETFVREHGRVSLIVIDTLQKVRETCTDNTYARDYSDLARLKELADRCKCALPGFVDSKNEEKTERNAGYLVVSHSGGGMLRQGTRKGIRRTPANRGMRAHRIVKSLDISEDVCHGLCP